MRFFSEELLAFPLATIVTLLLVATGASSQVLQQITLVLLLILIFTATRAFSLYSKQSLGKVKSVLMLFVGSFFVQLLIVATGGIRSPFLILIHLFSLGVSFLVNLKSSLFFLFFSLVVLIAPIYFSPLIKEVFLFDPSLSLLYIISFLYIVPLSVLLSRYYHVKDTILTLLRKELTLKEHQQASLLKGISEIIFVVDKNLAILSMNESAERTLAVASSEAIGKPLFAILFLKDKNGTIANATKLGIPEVFAGKKSVTADGLTLITMGKALPRNVRVQVYPILNVEGEIDQLTLVISDSTSLANQQNILTIEAASVKKLALMEEIKKKLLSSQPTLLSQFELVWKLEQDMQLLSEINQPITPMPVKTDIAQLCKQIIAKEQDFATALGVPLSFVFRNFTQQDAASLLPQGVTIPLDELTGPYFTVPIDVKWTQLLLQKLLDISLLLGSTKHNTSVTVGVTRKGEEGITVEITITFFHPLLHANQDVLFAQHYGQLETDTNLKLGSGFEGFLAKTIAEKLAIPLSYRADGESQTLTFSLQFSKAARAT